MSTRDRSEKMKVHLWLPGVRSETSNGCSYFLGGKSREMKCPGIRQQWWLCNLMKTSENSWGLVYARKTLRTKAKFQTGNLTPIRCCLHQCPRGHSFQCPMVWQLIEIQERWWWREGHPDLLLELCFFKSYSPSQIYLCRWTGWHTLWATNPAGQMLNEKVWPSNGNWGMAHITPGQLL